MEYEKSFKDIGVCDLLVEACENLGWKTPTQIQAQAIPSALEGKDIIGVAQTGTGKTGAFALPIIQALLDADGPRPFFACVIAPTRELAIQIGEVFSALGAGIGLKTAVLVGGVDMNQQQFALARRPHIIVGTPGRLLDHLTNTKGFSFCSLKHLVLDEADRLLDMDFEKPIDDILKVIPHERRTYLFSATMTKKVKKLQRACIRNHVKIEISSVYSTVDSLMQQYLLIPAKQKACALVYLLMKMPEYTSMVFTRTCAETEILALMLRFLGFRAMHFNGNMTQVKRLGALNKFKAGDCNILVCTNAAGRGLDISSVDLVIVYDVPAEQEDYIHWVGRTARAGKSGLAIALVTEYNIGNYYKIEQEIGKQLPTYPVEKEEMLLLYERVSVARRIADKKYKEFGGKKRKEYDDREETKYLPKKSCKKLKKIKRSRPY